MAEAEVLASKDPGADLGAIRFQMKPCPVMVGPTSHLAAEREQLAGLE